MSMRASSGFAVLAFLLAGGCAFAQPSTEVNTAEVAKQKEQIDAGLAKSYPHLDALYKDIHEHPELGFQEARTAAKLAAEMRSLGFEVTEHVGTTGLVANLFKRFDKPDIGFAQHVTGVGAAGTISYRPGVNSSAADGFQIEFAGRGSHGSRPQLSIDPVLEASRFVVDVQSVISREKDPALFGVLTVGSIVSGTAGNIIPDSATVRGTIRSYDEDTRGKLKSGLVRTARAVSDMAGAPPAQVTFDDGASAVVNDADVTARTAPVLKAAFGDKVILAATPNSASEDYSEFIIAGVPSLFWSIGGADPELVAEAAVTGKALPTNHSPQFAPVPEPAIRTGVEAMTLAVLNVMKK